MNNAVESGKRFYVTLTEDTSGGDVVVVGDLIGVAITGGQAGDTIAVERHLVADLVKVNGAVNQGEKAYWKSDEKRVTKTATGNTLIGCFWETAAAAAPTVPVLVGL